jgi:hypothetical protein
MFLAANGVWLWTTIVVVIWIALAFWPARVAARKGHSFFGYFLFSIVLLPGRADRRLHGRRPDDGCRGLS